MRAQVSFVLSQSTRLTDGQTDRQTDRQTEGPWKLEIPGITLHAVAR